MSFLHLSVLLLQGAVVQELDDGLMEDMEELLEKLEEWEENV